jgi:hypothetical protein
MKARIVLLVLALAVVMASSGSIVMADGAVVPFKARYVTHPEQVGFEDGVLLIEIPAEGLGTHLGLSTWFATMWVDTNFYPFTQGADDMVFTAANGDQLFGSYAGYALPTATGVKFWGTFQISGGTGRFEGTTGAGTYEGICGDTEGILYFDGMLNK